MMYPFMTLPDETAIVHSEMRDDGTVLVCCERPIDGDFKTAYCTIPGYVWSDIENYEPWELEDLVKTLKTLAHIIIRLSQNGGFASSGLMSESCLSRSMCTFLGLGDNPKIGCSSPEIYSVKTGCKHVNDRPLWAFMGPGAVFTCSQPCTARFESTRCKQAA